MARKSISEILSPPPAHMVGDGFRVHNFFPANKRTGLIKVSPFILMDYNAPYHFPPTDKPRGVGVHPHRGFETVTLAYQGSVAHHDSKGNSGVIEAGGVQWMTAAAGILHKEYHEENFAKQGGTFQMVQLWVNLPSRYKMSEPKYQGFTQSQLNTFALENEAGFVDLIAGELGSHVGPASTFSPMVLANIHLQAGAQYTLQTKAHHNTCLLQIKGGSQIDGSSLPTHHLAIFNRDGEEIEIEALEDSTLLLLSGEPIDEPMVAQGPFVMNTQEEIMQAFTDFENGAFGSLSN